MASKLEMYVDILNVLEQKGPQKASHILLEMKVNTAVLKGGLDFLIKQGLIEESAIEENGAIYINTPRGSAVVKFFTELDRTLSVKDNCEGKILPVSY